MSVKADGNGAVPPPGGHPIDCDLFLQTGELWNGTTLQNAVFGYGTEEERMLDWGIHCDIIQS
jgi:hypothetical protein